MDGKDFIALAGKLAATPSAGEATYRTAVSRAYYGAFHVARSFLADLGFAPVGNANVHGFVQIYLHGSGHAEARGAARLLSHLQSSRNRADYEIESAQIGSQRDAMLIVERAHRVVSFMESCRADAARDSIRQAIGEYERKLRPR